VQEFTSLSQLHQHSEIPLDHSFGHTDCVKCTAIREEFNAGNVAAGAKSWLHLYDIHFPTYRRVHLRYLYETLGHAAASARIRTYRQVYTANASRHFTVLQWQPSRTVPEKNEPLVPFSCAACEVSCGHWQLTALRS